MDPLSIAGYIALVASGILYLFSRLPKQTISNYKEYAESQDRRLQALESSDKDKTLQITTLQGKVDVLQTIPLADIAKAMADIMVTQKTILELINRAVEQRKKEK